MQAAAASGALVSINHPKPFGPPWEYPNAVGYHAIEVWNGHWQELNQVSLGWWDSQLRSGRRIVALGGSDTHRLRTEPMHDRLGSPTTWVRSEPTTAAVLAALKAGHAFISRDVDGPQLYLDRTDGEVRLRVVDGAHAALLLISERGVEHAYSVASSDWSDSGSLPACQYLRAQLVDATGQVLALTNPLYEL
jgi:hypothetical protein